MHHISKAISSLLVVMYLLITACSPIKTEVDNRYKLYSWGTYRVGTQHTKQSILISQPDAIDGYQTEHMLYAKTPFQVKEFAHNSWISPPANMLFALLIQSLDHSHYFYAITSSAYSDKTDYRLDTQLIQLQQNFMQKPSSIELQVKAVLTHTEDNRTIASKLFTEHVVCQQDTPFGGVVAANQAVKQLTASITKFVIQQITQQDNRKK